MTASKKNSAVTKPLFNLIEIWFYVASIAAKLCKSLSINFSSLNLKDVKDDEEDVYSFGMLSRSQFLNK